MKVFDRMYAVLLLLAVTGLLIGSLPAAEEGKVTGEVEVAEEDDDGNVVSVYVYDPDWGDVLVSNSGRGAELLDRVGAAVEMEGRLEEDTSGDYDWIIVVTDYTVLSG